MKATIDQYQVYLLYQSLSEALRYIVLLQVIQNGMFLLDIFIYEVFRYQIAPVFVITPESPDRKTTSFIIGIIVDPGLEDFRYIFGFSKIDIIFLSIILGIGLDILASIVGNQNYIISNGIYTISVDRIYQTITRANIPPIKLVILFTYSIYLSKIRYRLRDLRQINPR